ncbi:MAG: hypothetical protein JWN03_7600 [Nocardia sp.]|uniref:maleylpyruvate isomerase N-terminal domain-containing protein n=1 Tax=Nocardia sp. TaxID=1821 RepID=UPI00260DBB74|nr:maleylpyruvate isomerase N-terminal domain-containing protein [Nocardia sp.]MCU1647325.1 hypothetical protein [Nocardia sp.]
MVGGDLLERAVGFALGSLAAVSDADLSRRTPCSDWDLVMLLRHLEDSVDAVCDGIEQGRIDLGADIPAADDPLGAVRSGLCRLLGAWLCAKCDAITVCGLPLSTVVLADIAALEITVHAWDIGSACADPRTIPTPLATELLSVARVAVTGRRDPLFGARVPVPASACQSDRLVAFFGRDPAVWKLPSAQR